MELVALTDSWAKGCYFRSIVLLLYIRDYVREGKGGDLRLYSKDIHDTSTFILLYLHSYSIKAILTTIIYIISCLIILFSRIIFTIRLRVSHINRLLDRSRFSVEQFGAHRGALNQINFLRY